MPPRGVLLFCLHRRELAARARAATAATAATALSPPPRRSGAGAGGPCSPLHCCSMRRRGGVHLPRQKLHERAAGCTHLQQAAAAQAGLPIMIAAADAQQSCVAQELQRQRRRRRRGEQQRTATCAPGACWQQQRHGGATACAVFVAHWQHASHSRGPRFKAGDASSQPLSPGRPASEAVRKLAGRSLRWLVAWRAWRTLRARTCMHAADAQCTLRRLGRTTRRPRFCIGCTRAHAQCACTRGTPHQACCWQAVSQHAHAADAL